MANVLKIEITIGRPKTLLLWLCIAAAFIVWLRWVSTPTTASLLPMASPLAADTGGPTTSLPDRLAAEKDLRDARAERAIADSRADIVRYQLQVLEQQQNVAPDDTATEAALRRARLDLLGLLSDQREAEKRIAEALSAFSDDSTFAGRISQRSQARTATVAFTWPVEPLLGISAHFEDAAYKARFGVAHEGIDIPTNQGTTVVAAADAVVSQINDRGLGFNSIILSHAGGYATLYGHVSAFLVSKGQAVRAGDPIALSGGTPGTAGAGLLTTGPHLHFELLKDGAHVDPETVLPDF